MAFQTQYPGNELDPAEWVRLWRRFLGVCIVLGVFGGLFYWLGNLSTSTKYEWALMVGAFVGVFCGFALLSWMVYFVGRQIARVLWGILCSIERNKEQKEIFEQQREHLYGDNIRMR